MKTAMRTTLLTTFAFALSAALALPAFAQITLNGTVPAGTTPVVIIQANNQTGATGVLKFKFSAPTAGKYAFNLSIGPAANPCGSATSYVVVVSGGQERLAVVDASIFKNNVLVVGRAQTSLSHLPSRWNKFTCPNSKTKFHHGDTEARRTAKEMGYWFPGLRCLVRKATLVRPAERMLSRTFATVW